MLPGLFANMRVAGIELGIVFFFEAKVPRNNLLSRKDAKLAILTAVREATGYLWTWTLDSSSIPFLGRRRYGIPEVTGKGKRTLWLG